MKGCIFEVAAYALQKARPHPAVPWLARGARLVSMRQFATDGTSCLDKLTLSVVLCLLEGGKRRSNGQSSLHKTSIVVQVMRRLHSKSSDYYPV